MFIVGGFLVGVEGGGVVVIVFGFGGVGWGVGDGWGEGVVYVVSRVVSSGVRGFVRWVWELVICEMCFWLCVML